MSTTSLSSTLTSTATSTQTAASSASSQPASFKIIGVLLAVGSGLFIGSSFVFKKKGLLSAQAKAGTAAGEGHAYLKSPMWWTGMILMIVGEILNFVAYAFTDAILVTPLGALSVVICAILSSIFLKEKLTFFGKIGCFLCIVGAVVIALNGPEEQSVTTIKEFQDLFLSVGFLVYASVVIVASLVIIFFVAPKWGKKNMLVYILVCSLIGGLSVSCTQGLGASILTSIRGNNQFKHPFIYFLLGFVIVTLLTEINYLNKALELFNTAMVTPTYYVIFTFCTLVTSVILYQGFKAPVTDIITVVLGFLVICAGITLLQLSKIDTSTIASNLDRKSTLLITAAKAEVKPETDGNEMNEKLIGLEDPGVDAIRGSFGAIGSIHRAVSQRRMSQRMAHANSDVRKRRGTNDTSSHTTVGLEHVPRFQLYDNPMPGDASARISMFTNASIHTPSHDGPPRSRADTMLSIPSDSPDPQGRQRAPSINFAPKDVTHRYAPGMGAMAIHDTIERRTAGKDEKLGDKDSIKEEEDYPDPPFSAPTNSITINMVDDDEYEQRAIKSATLPRQQGTQTIAQMLKRQFSASSPDLTPDELREADASSESGHSLRVKALHAFGRKGSTPSKRRESEDREGLLSRTETEERTSAESASDDDLPSPTEKKGNATI